MTTKAEQTWMDAIVQLGCIVCILHERLHTPGHVHHLLNGGRRIDHLHTICLCPSHHNSGVNNQFYVSRHKWKREFERRYGTEYYLLEQTKKLLEGATT